jgi:ATP-dependent Lon protease
LSEIPDSLAEELEDLGGEVAEEELSQDLFENEDLPKQVYLVPLSRRPFFPGMAAPIVIEPGPYYEVLKRVAKSKHKFLGLVLTKDENCDIYKAKMKDLHEVGVLARVLRILPIETGGAQVVLNMEQRFRIKGKVRDSKFLRARIECFSESHANVSDELKAYSINIVTTIKELLKLNPLFKEELQVFLGHSDFTEPGRLADFSVALTTATRDELQEVLEAFDLQTRIDKSLLLLKKELDLSKLQISINQKIEQTITKSQKEYFLREQLRTIKKELGIEKDDKAVDTEKFEERLEQRVVPEPVMATIREELDKLNALEPMSAEYSVCRNYLDWLTILPWGLYSDECLNLTQAQAILEKDHYGLEDIKERILEFISVGKLAGGVRGSIIGLVGPPGVGKTSIGKSIARALNRKFYRFSVGGMRDEVEIKGHRRTYIGAMPGKLIQALKSCQTMNPVIMLDEVDKMGNSYHGDPASALLEVLDPEQNAEFLDHYLDVRCSLSNVLFIVTANVLDMIPEPLKDRMEILRLSGYIQEEKVEIAMKYLIPRNRKVMGLKSEQVSFGRATLAHIINGYARESGVRSLENYIKKILRKVAFEIAQEEEESEQTGKKRRPKRPKKVQVTVKALETYIGKPIFTSDRYYEHTPVGVCTGLAWTSLGGATLYVEAVKVAADKGGMKLTGQAGEVMRESAEIAWTYLHSAMNKFAPEFTFFENSQVHIHIPEGATPKDGPSAGVTMVTALLSLLLDTPVLDDLGMTGELTLTGRILAIGGVKEKLIAARRAKLKKLIFPLDNERDVEELPDYLKEGLEIYFVEYYDDIYRIAFPEE